MLKLSSYTTMARNYKNNCDSFCICYDNTGLDNVKVGDYFIRTSLSDRLKNTILVDSSGTHSTLINYDGHMIEKSSLDSIAFTISNNYYISQYLSGIRFEHFNLNLIFEVYFILPLLLISKLSEDLLVSYSSEILEILKYMNYLRINEQSLDVQLIIELMYANGRKIDKIKEECLELYSDLVDLVSSILLDNLEF